MGQRLLESGAAKQILGSGLLGQNRYGLAMDTWLLDFNKQR